MFLQQIKIDFPLNSAVKLTEYYINIFQTFIYIKRG